MMKERTMVDDEDNEVESFFIKDEIRQMSNITLTRNIPPIDDSEIYDPLSKYRNVMMTIDQDFNFYQLICYTDIKEM